MPEDAMTDTTACTPTRGVIPYLGLSGRAGEAADFYIRAFGAREIARIPAETEGQFMHIHLEINEGALMLTDCRAPWETAPAQHQGYHLQIVAQDGKAWFDRAVEAGCTVKVPFEKMFWGDLWGMFEDPFGLSWAIDQPAEFTA